MKGFWKYFSLAFEDSRTIAKKVHRSKSITAYRQIVSRFFEEEARWGGLKTGESIHDRFHPGSPF
jgi:hypothetical protein